MSLHDRPTPAEILEAVREYLLEEVAPTADRRARFRALIAANVLTIAERELAAAGADEVAEEDLLAALDLRTGTLDERRTTLARLIRNGEYDAPQAWLLAVAYARETVRRKLAVANPKFLERSSARARPG